MSVKLFKWFLNRNVYIFFKYINRYRLLFSMKNYKTICIKIVLMSQR